MAEIKPIDTSKPVTGIGSKLEAWGTACDMIGMTDIPVVSQGAEVISAGISLATGDYIGAALSVGSMLPVVGKVAETAKMGRRAKKLADGVVTAGKDTKLLTLTARNADDVAKRAQNVTDGVAKSGNAPFPSLTVGQKLADAEKNAQLVTSTAKNADDAVKAAKQTQKTAKTSSKSVPPQPAKNQAKSVEKTSAKEVSDEPRRLDINDTEYLPQKIEDDIWKFKGQSSVQTPSQSFVQFQASSVKFQKGNYEGYFCQTNSNPAANNIFRSTGKPLSI